MLEFFHKYQRSIIVYIFILVLSASMLLFGIDLMGSRTTQHAIKINETEISFREVAERRRQFEDQLRQQFGDAYSQFMQLYGENLEERIVDQMVEDELLLQIADSQHLAVDGGAVQEVIRGIFGGAYSAEAYQSYLRSRGISAVQFEAQIARESVRAEFQKVLQDFAEVSKLEALRQAQQSGSSYDVSIVSASSRDLLDSVPMPTEAEALEYYEENAIRYEEPARVQYNLVAITPESLVDTVEVYDEDVELYYIEHQSEFKVPARAQVAHVQINYGEDSSPEALLTVKERAQRIHERAVAGEDFAALVLEASDDITTKANAGSLGWLSEGTRGDAVEKAALAMGVVGIADVVETDYGFHIVKVEAFEPDSVKDLKEVEEEIRAKLKRLEAPAYALIKAEELFETWKESDVSLEVLAKKDGLTIEKAPGLLAEGESIADQYRRLTEKVLRLPSDTRQLVELERSSVLVEVVDFKEAEIPPFEKVREAVEADLRAKRARDVAFDKVQTAIDAAAEDTLVAAARAESLSVKELESVSAANANDAPLSNPDVRRALLSTRQPQLLTRSVVEQDDAFYAVAVTDVQVPAVADLKKPLAEYREEGNAESLAVLRGSLIQKARANAELEIDPALLGVQ